MLTKRCLSFPGPQKALLYNSDMLSPELLAPVQRAILTHSIPETPICYQDKIWCSCGNHMLCFRLTFTLLPSGKESCVCLEKSFLPTFHPDGSGNRHLSRARPFRLPYLLQLESETMCHPARTPHLRPPTQPIR